MPLSFIIFKYSLSGQQIPLLLLDSDNLFLEYNKMIAIVSSEGEEIKLERPVRAEGSVETWLTSLLQSAQSSLHAIIRNAVSVLNDPAFNLLLFLDKMPAQVWLLPY